MVGRIEEDREEQSFNDTVPNPASHVIRYWSWSSYRIGSLLYRFSLTFLFLTYSLLLSELGSLPQSRTVMMQGEQTEDASDHKTRQ